MNVQDVFVGAVAVIIGLLSVAAAVANINWAYQFWLARRVEARFGRRGARVYYAVLGLALIALGCAIATGYVANR